jgi:hypothetical protein
VAQLYPQALGTLLVASYDTHELRCDYSYFPATTREHIVHIMWKWDLAKKKMSVKV